MLIIQDKQDKFMIAFTLLNTLITLNFNDPSRLDLNEQLANVGI